MIPIGLIYSLPIITEKGVFTMDLITEANYQMSLVREKQEAEKAKKQHEEDKKNSDFVQVYRNHIEQIAELGAENATALKLLLFFIKHMDGSNALCVSNIALQEVFGYSKQTICKNIKYLKDNGWICVLKSGTANIYIVNPEVAWTSYGYQKQYCKFNATVFLSESENTEYLQNIVEKLKDVQDSINIVNDNT